MYKPLTDHLKKHFGKRVEKVSISNKLSDAPLFIFTSQYGYSAQMEKINKAQAFANQEKAPSYMLAKKSLELNPHHPVIKQMLELVKADGMGDAETEYIELMFHMALLNSGFNIDEPTELTTPLEKLIRVGFGVDREAEIEEIEVELDSPDDDAEVIEDDGDDDEPEAMHSFMPGDDEF